MGFFLRGRYVLEKKERKQVKWAKMAKIVKKKLTRDSSGHLSVCLYKETLTINNEATNP